MYRLAGQSAPPGCAPSRQAARGERVRSRRRAPLAGPLDPSSTPTRQGREASITCSHLTGMLALFAPVLPRSGPKPGVQGGGSPPAAGGFLMMVWFSITQTIISALPFYPGRGAAPDTYPSRCVPGTFK